ncbi:hypothetical protein JTB14_038152 [Gonioctena quinquepunctata]|nr:hypothetical protein JTB14_038152 [Gonioctena quinquepunctata]
MFLNLPTNFLILFTVFQKFHPAELLVSNLNKQREMNSKSSIGTFLDIFSCLICLGDILGNSTNLVQCVNGHTICED